MTNLITRTVDRINSSLNKFQVKRFFAVVLVGVLVLTTNIAFGDSEKALGERVRQKVEQNDAERPKTVGQWFKDARETKNEPGKRLEKIGQQSGEALKEFGSGYVEGAKETADEVGNSAAKAGRNLSR
ncbi:hypothetical protein I8752_30640 [Nostocaceae cyanobacterium CENA369]|uniref:Uncharacterized protein n=1 Tax=Dendronalium phyllosphericum CENA369 TaxID=1725256 RepID=A0A8J7LJ39_9NOST|nr:hypothetical protein [Dendronalium phyllosphericum]MBH8577249.1 hypothetical protein [Dendronalium phyllosphericum CENA369]